MQLLTRAISQYCTTQQTNETRLKHKLQTLMNVIKQVQTKVKHFYCDFRIKTFVREILMLLQRPGYFTAMSLSSKHINIISTKTHSYYHKS